MSKDCINKNTFATGVIPTSFVIGTGFAKEEQIIDMGKMDVLSNESATLKENFAATLLALQAAYEQALNQKAKEALVKNIENSKEK